MVHGNRHEKSLSRVMVLHIGDISTCIDVVLRCMLRKLAELQAKYMRRIQTRNQKLSYDVERRFLRVYEQLLRTKPTEPSIYLDEINFDVLLKYP